MRLVQRAQVILQNRISSGDLVIDATVGNGQDTVFLAQTVGRSGRVFGFDIQAAAIENTQRLLQQYHLQWVTLFKAGHEEMKKCIPQDCHGRISAVMFNLGYLPGSDKGLTTTPSTTLCALAAAAQLLDHGAIMSIIAYRAHPGGEKETHQVNSWADSMPTNQWEVNRETPSDIRAKSPQLIILKKL